MTTAVAISALVIGLMANLHCLGMCGPIALAVPVTGTDRISRVLSVLTYNGGRILMYGMIGALFGLFGEGLSLVGMQQTASIVLGALIVLFGLVPYLAKRLRPGKTWMFSPWWRKVTAKLFGRRTYPAIFSIGLLNALLPCGVVYLALVGAVATGTIKGGMLYMMLFGLGTLPVMTLLPLLGQVITGQWQQRIRKALPFFAIVFGLLLIARGAGLGIPFISPDVGAVGDSCCTLPE